MADGPLLDPYKPEKFDYIPPNAGTDQHYNMPNTCSRPKLPLPHPGEQEELLEPSVLGNIRDPPVTSSQRESTAICNPKEEEVSEKLSNFTFHEESDEWHFPDLCADWQLEAELDDLEDADSTEVCRNRKIEKY